MKIGDEVIVRTYSAGVFFGKLASWKEKQVTLKNAIRIWYWDGAASLSQLAVEGTSNPETCKFGVPVAEVALTEAIELLSTTPKARASIRGVGSWRK